ncbi:remorin-like isoform X2 [Abrus precatorius]|uniref:Remorin-like isoform X2 n=1 Tax=Abrus precatorius TaxID=3816 RepID=A0A8B8LZZ9_ABRPR|nr:remorin-like isoform X2 [Abrus precatorius]
MENLFNQIRVQFTGAEEKKAGLGGTKDQKIPIQKTQSFKEKKEGGQNWFKKQFARKTDRDDDSRDMEHAAAVAAAAFAINLQDVSEHESKTKEASFTKTKSKVDGTKSSISLLGSASKRLSSSFKLKDDQGGKVPKSSVTDEKKPEGAITPAPSMKKTSTFTDTKPEIPSPIIPPPPSTKHDPLRQTTPPTDTERQKNADEWERTELENIRQRYDKLREKIDSWESKKKMNARRKLEKEERDLIQRKLKAWDDFQTKYKYIDQIAVGARTKAEESRKNEELKAKEKANVIRTTGKLPRICFCF